MYLYLAVGVVAGSVAVMVYLKYSAPTPFHNPMLCPECGKKLSRPDADCPWCLQKKIQDEMKAAQQAGAQNQDGSSTLIKLGFMLCACALVAVAIYWPQLRVLFRPREQAVKYFTIRCSNCRRKIRYRAEKSGGSGLCPRCRWVCAFPEAEGT